jgi:hypothetical protein
MRPLKALQYLRSGLDTIQIAAVLKCSEAEAYNRIQQEREAERLVDFDPDFQKPLSRKAEWHLRNGALVFGPVPQGEGARA